MASFITAIVSSRSSLRPVQVAKHAQRARRFTRGLSWNLGCCAFNC